MIYREEDIRRIKRELEASHLETERLQREVNRLKGKAKDDERKRDRTTGAVNGLLNALENFLDNESGTIYELRNEISIVKGAL